MNCIYKLAIFSLVLVTACRKKEAFVTVPEVTTTAASAVTPVSAVSGGTITNKGGAEIMSTGVAYSRTNQLPAITDDTTNRTISPDNFISELGNLQPSSTYYVRAYAVNRAGIGYGNVITFVTGNGAPTATGVTISGIAEVNRTLTATYTYSDVENDPESGTTFQWYVSDNSAGNGATAIAGATSLTYIVQPAEQNKYILFGVTPNASGGTSPGTEVRSSTIGAIGEATTVTFLYNGQTVTYGIIVSPVTGRKWLDRNLGAPNAASSFDDFANYGDLFQWGRAADGHQLINRNGNTNALTEAVNQPASTVQSTTPTPGHVFFIRNSGLPADWLNPRNSNLWQGVNGVNNPCPAGWRIPTRTEWEAENLATIGQAYTQLKITAAGTRSPSSGNFSNVGTDGRYWTTTIVPATTPTTTYRVTINAAGTGYNSNFRAAGESCRCIRD